MEKGKRMSIKNSGSHFSLSHEKTSRLCSLSRALGCMGLAITLATSSAKAAPSEPPATEKPRNIVADFRLEGSLSEEPGDDSFDFFGPMGTSLNELVTRLR